MSAASLYVLCETKPILRELAAHCVFSIPIQVLRNIFTAAVWEAAIEVVQVPGRLRISSPGNQHKLCSHTHDPSRDR